MKITFVYTDYGRHNRNNFNRGLAILSSCLKQAGYTVSLIHISKPIGKEGFVSLIKSHRPDLAVFSFMSDMFPQIKTFSLWVKELGIPALHGGLHPTFVPEECLAEEGIDVICRGEGEGAIVDYCRAFEAGKNTKNIPNIWVKEGEQIYRNACRGLIEDLDALPYPDYEIFEYEKLEESLVYKVLVSQASRGCLYNCTYCCNPLLKALYPNQKYLRYHGVDRLLDEIDWALKKYPFLKEVRFYDDTLTQDKNWFKKFAVKYKNRIGLPYSGNERVENVDLKTAQALKVSGCVSLDLGIESGDEFIREKYMNRYMSNDKIINAFSVLQSCGIKTNSFNLLGMLGETPGSVLKTIKLNAFVRPNIVFRSYFYPFKGTIAYDYVMKKGCLINKKVESLYDAPAVKLDTISQSQLTFYYKYFSFIMRIYEILWKIFKKDNVFIKAMDKTITSKYFPYYILNYMHFGKQEIMTLSRKYPKLYAFLRGVYLHAYK